jgi:hypothetical protein
MLAACTERFERRLSEEIAGVRVQIAQTEAVLRRDMAEMRADIRGEMAQMGTDLRKEIAHMGADLRRDMATGRVEMLKWCFLCWIGQVVTIIGVLRLFSR